MRTVICRFFFIFALAGLLPAGDMHSLILETFIIICPINDTKSKKSKKNFTFLCLVQNDPKAKGQKVKKTLHNESYQPI